MAAALVAVPVMALELTGGSGAARSLQRPSGEAARDPGHRFAVGLLGISVFESPLPDAEKVFIRLVDLMFHPLVAGICLAAILAAIMSTADSQLLVASCTFTGDIYRQQLRR